MRMQHDIILIANEPWENFTWRRRHHVAWELSKKHKVLFVEPPCTVLTPVRGRNISWRQLMNLGRLKHRGRNLYSYSPLKVLPLSLPFSKTFDFDGINRKAALAGLKRAVEEIEIKDPILWVYFSPEQYDYYGLLGEILAVGDIYDKFGASTWKGMLPEHSSMLQRRQDFLIKKSDIVFTVSQGLYNELEMVHPSVYLIQNGVDYESFEDSPRRENAEAIKGLKAPVLGFLGMLHYKVDFGLLNYIAENHPEWTLLLMGKDNIHDDEDRKAFNELKSRRNVRWCKEIDREAIPCFLSMTDVCLVPLKKLEMNRYANFLKIWEYLAAGKPIVAVDQGVNSEYPDLIRFAAAKEEFVSNISESLDVDTGYDLVMRRKNIAKSNSWENRTKKMLEIIEETLAIRGIACNEV